jgi:hypothetical protein
LQVEADKAAAAVAVATDRAADAAQKAEAAMDEDGAGHNYTATDAKDAAAAEVCSSVSLGGLGGAWVY